MLIDDGEKMRIQKVRLFLILFLFFSIPVIAENKESFSEAQLDQMMAPIALYPDSLLSQILMASTYPADVSEAVKWSKENASQKGDAAVKAVQDKKWDPSVMSLVAFPQVLEMMGKKPDWVQNLGDAFLATPDKVMDSAQKLRKKAKDEGNLKTTKQQVVSVEKDKDAKTESHQSVIIIEPADPEIVYVPVYNPTVVYGVWWWPHYTPYYYRPIGYPLASGIAFGIGIGITRSLWGGCNWRHGSVNININKYNNINRNQININNKSSTWKHNSNNRKGTPYRDKSTRDKYNNNRAGADSRKDYRGRTQDSSKRNADRQKAQNTLKQRGADPVAGRSELRGKSGNQIRNQTNKINQQQNRANKQSFDRSNKSNKLSHRGSSNNRSSVQSRSNSNALSGVRNSGRTTHNVNRGSSSMHSRGGSRGGGMRGGGRGGRR